MNMDLMLLDLEIERCLKTCFRWTGTEGLLILDYVYYYSIVCDIV